MISSRNKAGLRRIKKAQEAIAVIVLLLFFFSKLAYYTIQHACIKLLVTYFLICSVNIFLDVDKSNKLNLFRTKGDVCSLKFLLLSWYIFHTP